MLKQAERQRLIARNPVRDVDFLDERKLRRQACVLTVERGSTVASSCEGLPQTADSVAVDTGLRVGKEALPLKWADLDFLNDMVHVRDSKTPAGRRSIPSPIV